ncbi:Lysine-tRNA ligase [Melia azedarach]|uniref:Lysine-tRNA ligase n=1 Tax=Melia azedarach TaxID=155640 RepID=A0ACC1X7J8_MELAZ|nr:Lysine-tRNA ligase [Melia azedarach]
MVAAVTVSSPKSSFLQNPVFLRDPRSSLYGGSLKSFSLQLKSRSRKRDFSSLVIASAGEITTSNSRGRFYLNFTGFPFPLGPFLNRRTIRTEVVKGRIWLFEQEQALGFSSVSTNIRMTVIKLKSWRIMGPCTHRPNRGVYSACEGVGGSSRVWVAPRQWSWPLNLPLAFFGIFRAKTLIDEDLSTPWIDEIEQKVLSSPEVGIGPYVEVAFYHKPSRTLLVTDAAKNGLAVKILSKGREVPQEPVIDNQMNRQKGWERMVLQILFLGPSNLLEPNGSFAQMSQKLIVSPIVKTLVFSKVPEKVRDWIDRIARDWSFRRIIPAHFAAPINANRSDFLAAFAFLDDLLGERYITRPSLSLLFTSLMGKAASYFPPDDMKTLSSLDQFLVSVGAVKKTVSGRKR